MVTELSTELEIVSRGYEQRQERGLVKNIQLHPVWWDKPSNGWPQYLQLGIVLFSRAIAYLQEDD